MQDCNELIYERFRIECYPLEAVSCSQNPLMVTKTVPQSMLQVDSSRLYMEIGSFPSHTGKRISTNDTAKKVNTKVSEKTDNSFYKVSIRFQFEKGDANSLNLCMALNIKPFYFFIRYLGMDGRVVGSRFISNDLGSSQASITEEQGLVTVEITLANVNGIQTIVP